MAHKEHRRRAAGQASPESNNHTQGTGAWPGVVIAAEPCISPSFQDRPPYTDIRCHGYWRGSTRGAARA
ncbi:UNVERIFIED_CONTAM: hypothetical protein K2H54_044050 [Gekko kuhli]